MGIGLLRIASALAAFALMSGAMLALGAADDGSPTGGLEVKHIGAGDRVTVENLPTTPARKNLIPFPEDELEAAAGPRLRSSAQMPDGASAASRPAANAVEQRSAFQPRFRAPGVRQAQHTQPIADEGASESEVAVAQRSGFQPVGQPGNPTPSAGREIVDQAFAKSKAATSAADFTEVIDLCRRGMKAGLKQGYDDYARRLMGWAYNRRGEALVDEKRDKEALADFEAAVQCNDRAWRAMHNRGVSYAALGRTDEALADFEHTIQLNKKYPNAYFNRGELRYEQGDFAGAAQDYTAAIELGRADTVALNSRGHAFRRLNRYGDALGDYGEAIRLEPDNVAALVGRGDTYCEIGQYGEAAKDYRAAVEANSRLGRAYRGAAWLMATCPDPHYRNEKLAIEAARKALDLDGDTDFRDLETLAAAQANAGLFAEAKATQERAIAQAPQSQRVQSEKLMALYQREQPYRETPVTAFAHPEDEPEHPVRKASATGPLRPARRRARRRILNKFS